MNSDDDSLSGLSGCAALWRRTNSLNAATSSSFVRTLAGCHTPWPVIEVPVVCREAMVDAGFLAQSGRFGQLRLDLGERRSEELGGRVRGDRHLELEDAAAQIAAAQRELRFSIVDQ